MIKQLIDLIKAYAKSFGIEEWIVNDTILLLLIIGGLLSIINYLWKFVKWVKQTNDRRILNNDLHPFFTKEEVYNATQYYIPTKSQNVAPSNQDLTPYIADPKEKLIPLMLQKAFKTDDQRFYIVLADAGMGKTTFMINLYLAYKKQWVWWNRKFVIQLFPLGSPKTIKKIKEIKDKKNTILLLDAFDEDNEALHNYQNRMCEVIEQTWEFREVIITCRTQFFPSKIEEPHDTGIMKFGGEGGEHYFKKMYVSIFDNKDVRSYLFKRYSPWNPLKWVSLSQAWSIASKSPNLVVRPMLLSYIDDLLQTKRKFKYTIEIYEALIQKWLEREANKSNIVKKYGSKERFKQLLYFFSQKLAVNLYENREKRGGLFINIKEEGFGDSKNVQLSDYDELQLSEPEKRSKSLLNRNSEGKYKFSHKSILEYFLMLEIIENRIFAEKFNFEGMEVVQVFKGEFRDILGIKTDLITHLSNLDSLDLSNNKLNDISVLPKLPQLSTLNLSNNNLSDISVLIKLPQLSTLNLSNNKLSDISVLTKLPQLRTLNLYHNNVSDISVLAKLSQLRTLNLSFNKLSDISALAKLPQLSTLDLRGNNQIKNISALAKLPQLSILDLRGNPKIKNISVLAKLPQLSTLDLRYNNLNESKKKMLKKQLPNAKIYF